jgi:hypothetical protein
MAWLDSFKEMEEKNESNTEKSTLKSALKRDEADNSGREVKGMI